MSILSHLLLFSHLKKEKYDEHSKSNRQLYTFNARPLMKMIIIQFERGDSYILSYILWKSPASNEKMIISEIRTVP